MKKIVIKTDDKSTDLRKLALEKAIEFEEKFLHKKEGPDHMVYYIIMSKNKVSKYQISVYHTKTTITSIVRKI